MTKVVDLVMMRQWDAAQRGALSTWTVYDPPRDHPDCFVARRFESEKGNPEPAPTSDAIAAFELQPLRDAMIRAGLTVVPRMEGDQPHIVEVWL